MVTRFIIDIVFVILYSLALFLSFEFLGAFPAAIIFFALLVLTLAYRFSVDSSKEEISKEYLEKEGEKELRTLRRHIIDMLVERMDIMIEKVKYLKLLLKGEVLVLE
jgi:type III secretory pathway component EscU